MAERGDISRRPHSHRRGQVASWAVAFVRVWVAWAVVVAGVRADAATTLGAWDFGKDASGWSVSAKSLARTGLRGDTPSGDGLGWQLSGSRPASGRDWIRGPVVDLPEQTRRGAAPAARIVRATAQLFEGGGSAGAPADPAIGRATLRVTFLDRSGRSMGQRFAPLSPRRPRNAWFEQRIEVVVPKRAVAIRIAIGSPKGERGAVTLRVDRIELAQLDDRREIGEGFADRVEKQLVPRAATGPRLLLSPERVRSIRRAVGLEEGVAPDERMAALWRDFETYLAPARSGKRAPKSPSEATRGTGNHQRFEALWLVQLAFAYRVSGDPADLAASQRYARTIVAYPEWGDRGVSLAAAHVQLALALYLDWCGEESRELASPIGAGTLRDALVDVLRDRSAFLFDQAVLGEGATWWAHSPRNNQAMLHLAGLGAAALALRAEDTDAVGGATKWLGLALSMAEDVLHVTRPSPACLADVRCPAPDGLTNEGLGYWAYGAEATLMFLDLAKRALGMDLLRDAETGALHPWWWATTRARLHLGVPMNAWRADRQIVDLGDAERRNWWGPDALLRRLAAIARDPVAQGLAYALSGANPQRSNFADRSSLWLSLLWTDTTLEPMTPAAAGEPTFSVHADFGVVTTRTDWSGDESLVVTIAGPDQGKLFGWLDPRLRLGSKAHLDANHVVVFGAGEWLIRDGNHRSGSKRRRTTGQHNTLLVDGEGQHRVAPGEDAPDIVAARTGPVVDVVAMEAAAAYDGRKHGQGGGPRPVRRFLRHVVFDKSQDVMIVVDDVELDREREMELRWHTERALDDETLRAGCDRASGACLRIDLLTPSGVDVAATELDGLETLRLRRHADRWQNVVAFAWSRNPARPVAVELLPSTKTVRRFRVGKHEVELDLEAHEARVVTN